MRRVVHGMIKAQMCAASGRVGSVEHVEHGRSSSINLLSAVKVSHIVAQHFNDDSPTSPHKLYDAGPISNQRTLIIIHPQQVKAAIR